MNDGSTDPSENGELFETYNTYVVIPFTGCQLATKDVVLTEEAASATGALGNV
ncbi:hypothetical protein TASCI_10338 [Tenacibaculum ascidiaceicola]